MHACVEGVNSRWCMHDTVQEKHARILRHACISAGIPRLARPEMGNASGRAEDLADADMDDGNNVRRASSSSAGYVRGGGSSSSPPASPPRPHSPRMFVPQVRSPMITPHLLEFELLASAGGSPSARRACVWSISWDLHRPFVWHAVFLFFCCALV